MSTQTSNIGDSESLTLDESFRALDSFLKEFEKVPRLRYAVSEFAPIEPVISRTKSYEMVIVHPAAIQNFLCQFEMTNSQLAFVGLTPATDEEWREWSKELLEQMRDGKSHK